MVLFGTGTVEVPDWVDLLGMIAVVAGEKWNASSRWARSNAVFGPMAGSA
jgi:hypothetical protein